jgi:predicted glycosyltransferase
MTLPRLDILLYAHDGRGLGHISRTVAIGMALRRLYPVLRVLVVSGCDQTRELIGSAPLDWLKLPSYRTEVVSGKSRGIDGCSGFSDQELGRLRAAALEQIVLQYRPRVILADHTPQGKHRELLPALEAAADSRWVLGVRGVVGDVPQAGSQLSQQLFTSFFNQLLWYGDTRILGREELVLLESRYGTAAEECGYVSRLGEINTLKTWSAGTGELAGTIAVPWQGEHSGHVLHCIVAALRRIGPGHGQWRIFADLSRQEHGLVCSLVEKLPHCRVQPPGPGYIDALLRSGIALIYGGYNSVTDVLAAGIPAVVLLRAMQDGEQQKHLALLADSCGRRLLPCAEEQLNEEQLEHLLLQQLEGKQMSPCTVNLLGAENAAHALAGQCRV